MEQSAAPPPAKPQRIVTEPLNESRIINGLRLSYLDNAAQAGDRPVVVLLHGFPDRAAMWSPQIAALTDAGFRVIAPDLRGYGDSEIADDVQAYHVTHVVADIIALMDALEIDRFHLAGHDWGAALAWIIAGAHPHRVHRLAVLSVGHPTAYARGGIAQKIRGWYVLLFLMRGVAERLIRSSNWRRLRRLMRTHPELDTVVADLSRPGRLTAALGLYRANLGTVLLRALPSVRADTLGVFGSDDAFLTRHQMQDSERFVRGQWRFVELPGGHWLGITHPEAVNAVLLEHFSGQ